MYTVPLTDDDRDTLLFIYRKRRRFFIQVCIGLVLIALYTSSNGFRMSATERGLSFPERLVLCALVDVILLIAMIIVYRLRIARLKRDADNGVKEMVALTITDKQYFEHTNQFFIRLNHPGYMHYELDSESWHALQPGDTFALYKAPLSGHVFAFNGKYTIL